ncbi:hypothetical protein SESBI_15044 [Sesbania bispinosa]|nr:hypothetical protein SESBI_15044 [Sesbania bispinosa]
MGGETMNGTWLSGFWSVSRKSASDDKEVIGILAFEIAGLMSKVVNLWHSLGDREVMSLREWMVNSVGVKMLVSDDDYFLMELALNEILNNFESLARSVARLGKKCRDPVYHGYERFVHNPGQNYLQWSGWEYRWKKMDRKVKKMERFVAAMSLLSQEFEVLTEREQTFRRMKVNPEFTRVKLLEFQKKVMWQRQQVENLRNMSPWNRSYDYIVRLLARSLFTILERIILVFGNSSHLPIEKQQNDSPPNNHHLARNHSFPAPMHSSVHPSETNSYNFCSEPCVVDKSKRKKKEQQVKLHSESSKQLKHIGPFKGCMSVGNESPVVQSCMSTNGGSMRMIDCHKKHIDNMKTVDKLSVFYRSRVYFKLSLKGRLKPAPSTLGDAALALHYANVIVLIEKIVSAPHLIDLQTRDDLYNMLPTTIRTSLRAKLKWYAKSKPNTVHDASLALEWSLVLTQILEWLAPLAHNMVRWHSERNFEKEHTTLKANVLLVQTLYFANQAKTEAAMVELLVGLHYVCRIDREARLRETQEFAGSRSFKGLSKMKGPLKKGPIEICLDWADKNVAVFGLSGGMAWMKKGLVAYKIYRALSYGVSPLIRLHLRWRRFRGLEHPRRWPERLGHPSQPRRPGPLVWFHAVSLGEGMIAIPVIKHCIKMMPHLNVLMTTTTLSAFEVLSNSLPSEIILQFSPVDTPASIHSFLHYWKPNAIVLMESELWPNLIMDASRNGITLALLNARISVKSFEVWSGPMLLPLISLMLSKFSLIVPLSTEQGIRFQLLQAPPYIINFSGDLKYVIEDIGVNERGRKNIDNMKLQLSHKQVWMASSIHWGEEEIILGVHAVLMQLLPNIMTIIVPRHPQQGREIAKKLEKEGQNVVLRSQHEKFKPGTNIYVVDTLGELRHLYTLTPIAVIGGSFLPSLSGHNISEAAAAGCAILTGCHVGHFSHMVLEMQQSNPLSVLQVSGKLELEKALIELFTNTTLLEAHRRAAKEAFCSLSSDIVANIWSLLNFHIFSRLSAKETTTL